MPCKRRLKVRVCIEDVCEYTEATLHPRGCMGASRTHLDIPVSERLKPLEELGAKRGMSLEYIVARDCIEAVTPIGLLRLCGVPSPRSPRIYIRVLKRGWVYVGL